MTSSEFRNIYFGRPVNHTHLLKKLGIQSFAGIPNHRLGWAGFVNAIGDHFGLDVRNFSCEARFIDALAEKVGDEW